MSWQNSYGATAIEKQWLLWRQEDTGWRRVNCGVPQWSILVPLLSNVVYDFAEISINLFIIWFENKALKIVSEKTKAVLFSKIRNFDSNVKILQMTWNLLD